MTKMLWDSTLAAASACVVLAVSETTERAMVDELVRPKEPGDTHAMAGNRREAKLRELFAGLSPHESLALQRRLEMALPEDELAVAFLRLVPERRARLLAHLAELRYRRFS